MIIDQDIMEAAEVALLHSYDADSDVQEVKLIEAAVILMTKAGVNNQGDAFAIIVWWAECGTESLEESAKAFYAKNTRSQARCGHGELIDVCEASH